jgi:radical SAM protein with 4Fe4S-binding SPASM domain
MITAYIKPTNFCNVGCSHCYLPEFVRANKTMMSMETFLKVAERIKDYADQYGRGDVHVLWHGGEPLLVPLEWYDKANGILREIGITGSQSMQTSLVPYRSEYASFIKEKMGGRLGVSYDFSSRKLNGSSEAYTDMFMSKVDMARADGLGLGVTMTVTKNELGRAKEIVDWYLVHGFSTIKIERYTQHGMVYQDWVTNMEHSLFMVDLLETILSLYEKNILFSEGVTLSAIRGVMQGVSGDRWGTSCVTDFLVFEPDGETSNCTDRTGKEASFGSVYQPLKLMMENETRSKIVSGHMSGENIKDHCFSCEYVSWCKSGCPLQVNEVPSETTDCSGHRYFLDHIKKILGSEKRDVLLSYAEKLGISECP